MATKKRIQFIKSTLESMRDMGDRKKQELLSDLQVLQDDKDYERSHCLADELLLAYIGDKEVTEAFNKIKKY